MKKLHYLILLSFVMFSGCATTTAQKAFTIEESQVKIRNIQSRTYDITDKKMLMQAIISTMQDLDFVIEKADFLLGMITGTKFFTDPYLGPVSVTMSVTVKPKGKTQMIVRVNLRYGTEVIEDPETYQDFFTALGKSLFLSRHKVD